jgi:hypothetical protein
VQASLVFAAIIQFLIAAVYGLLTIGSALLLIAVQQSQDIFSPNTASDYAFGVVLAGAAALHIILGVGVLRLRKRAMVASLWVSVICLMIPFVFLFPSDDLPGSDGVLGPAIFVFALIVSADIATLLQLRRAE